ncbi:MAG: hypothetical protein D6796_07200 [Caldilineae bacterium]|nr:MAG: hypothetical protein D6796_07200 [Caldilineae bacterium]
MPANPTMTVQQARDLLRKLVAARDGDELKKLVADHIMWCDGIFFAELDLLVEEFERRGDEASAAKLKSLGDYMARLRFMI